jgi:hypothetical protein
VFIWLVMPRNVGDRHLSVANEPAALNGSASFFLRGSQLRVKLQSKCMYCVALQRYIAIPSSTLRELQRAEFQ